MSKHLIRIEALERQMAAKRLAQSFPKRVLRHAGHDGLPLPLVRIFEKGWRLYVRRAWDRVAGESEKAFDDRGLSESPRGVLMAALNGKQGR